MNKILFLFFVSLISSCTARQEENITSDTRQITEHSEQHTEQNKKDIPEKQKNKKCMDMEHFKIIQVFQDNSALAKKCDSISDKYCSFPVVLLTPQQGVDYYDDMYVGLPDNKCAVQDGVYRYETRQEIIKTVPRIKWDYKYPVKKKNKRSKNGI